MKTKLTENLTKIIVTPQQAEMWLAENHSRQRAIREAVVNMYASDMVDGSWDESIINPIRFTKGGKLIDGQHRLKAVVVANKPVTMWVQFGLDDDAFESIDIGAKRTPADILGGENSKYGASILANIAGILYGTGGIQSACHKYKSVSPRTTVPISEVMKASEVVDIQRVIALGYKVRRSLGCGSVTAYGFAYWIIGYLYGDDVADMFIDDFVSDTPFQSSYVVRRYITSAYLSKKRVEIEKLVEAILFAYENYMNNKIVKLFRWSGAVLREYNERLTKKKEEDLES